jgi:hypothetical protein
VGCFSFCVISATLSWKYFVTTGFDGAVHKVPVLKAITCKERKNNFYFQSSIEIDPKVIGNNRTRGA